MLYPFNDRRPFADIATDIERLRSLVRDLECIRRGEHPDDATLADAPALHDWSLARRPEACLAGTMLGHPKIPDGQPGVTSGVWFLAPNLGYARSLTRFYALGRPLPSPLIGRRLS